MCVVVFWSTLATEAEAETEESLRSGMSRENGDGRIIAFWCEP